tara:strand:+ start:3618 stop:4031 length:414 start_codon:yes stop_codon:yes gene_type:complete
MLRFAFKALWRLLRLAVRLMVMVLKPTFGLAWRLTLGRSVAYVRRDWNDRGVGRVRWSQLRDPRLDTLSGGAQVENPLPLLHGYVWCDKVRGEIGHSCAHGPGPHNIKVCMLREDNTRLVWRRLLDVAGPDCRLESG